ncbi:hypothetical protein [Paenibacillus gansuensis]|uniref:Uncharacterized protein n=1 Tax=Paenibacillus gansuensis TaxID=306542 RepID=A0ABW5P706_9BACL
MDHEVGKGHAYEVTDLEDHAGLLQEIRQLESRMREELGEEITLISYSKNDKDISGCRAGLAD